ncbi:MAG: cyclic nucleotide-binding domain-containing protein [Deltaproteobacteria bacterium]|nr:cyclic nucleotide-binding domain-containing protein [Deltaproteobacteria bacterium]
MLELKEDSDLSFLIEAYFNDESRWICLKKGDVLIRQGSPNDRLYLVLKGALTASASTGDGREHELFQIVPHMFVGVYSFFSQTYKSLLTVTAEEDSGLAYIEAGQLEKIRKAGGSIFEQFVPVIIMELMHRYQQTLELNTERERTIKKLLQSEKMASLGQMAAGIAHELNNAIAVLQRNSEWLCREVGKLLAVQDAGRFRFYEEGLEKGQSLSSRELRRRSRAFREKYGISDRMAGRIAEMGIAESGIEKNLPPEKEINCRYTFWKIGTAFHDMQLAARQSTHVVKSIKTLGAPHTNIKPNQDVNESINRALSLLQSSLRAIQVHFETEPLPAITANQGELVQIWTNLIKNACESMESGGTVKPQLKILSRSIGDRIVVRIEDNGPGIDPDLVQHIFQPNVTTKVDGLSFGLGLGLSIVENLVHQYGGTVSVTSHPGKTIFEVQLPIGEEDGRIKYNLHR